MRYPVAEKLEIVRIVEQSHLPAKRPPVADPVDSTKSMKGRSGIPFLRWVPRWYIFQVSLYPLAEHSKNG